MKQALCPICGQPVPHAYYDNDGKLQAEEGHAICGDSNLAYHYERGQDCWGKKIGYPNFLTEQEMMRLSQSRLISGCCPNCNVKLIRGRNIKDKIVNLCKLLRFCPNCGFTASGI